MFQCLCLLLNVIAQLFKLTPYGMIHYCRWLLSSLLDMIIAMFLDRAAHYHRYKYLLPINVFITCSLPLMTTNICYANYVHDE